MNKRKVLYVKNVYLVFCINVEAHKDRTHMSDEHLCD